MQPKANRRHSRFIFVLMGAVLLFVTALSSVATLQQPTEQLAATTLTGTVRAPGGDAMEGVVVSARRGSSTMTTSVLTDADGVFIFPALETGTYQVWAQAIGYEMGRTELRIDAARQARHDFSLKTIADFKVQLTGAEWIAALPEDTPANKRMKLLFQSACLGCHPAGLIFQNRFDAAGWGAIVDRMNASNGNTVWVHYRDELAQYLATMSGPGPSPMKPVPFPRAQGEATRVVITEYDVPVATADDVWLFGPGARDGEALAVHNGSDWSQGTPAEYGQRDMHDVVPDRLGNAWVVQHRENTIRSYAKVNVKTGEVANFPVPESERPTHSRDSHALAVGDDGYVWINMSRGRGDKGGVGKIDPKTGRIEVFAPPQGMDDMYLFVNVDGKGKVWGASYNAGGLRFDPDTKTWTQYMSLTPNIGKYDIAGDAEGNGWWAGVSHDLLGMADIKTGTSKEIFLSPKPGVMEWMTKADMDFYKGPDGPMARLNRQESDPSRKTVAAVVVAPFPWAQGPRRMGADTKGNNVYAVNWWGKNLVGVDIRTHQVTYYPTPFDAYAYDLHVGPHHEVWTALWDGDRAARLDPATKQWTTFPLPSRGTEVRHVSVDQTNGDVWLCYVRTNRIARVQFRTERDLVAIKSKLPANRRQ